MDYIVLSNGVRMPQLGYGVYQVTKEECERCVLDALKAGYRLIDTAQSYFNKEEVGSAIKKSNRQIIWTYCFSTSHFPIIMVHGEH